MTIILVVDDSPVSLRLLSYTLQQEGHTAMTASHGGEALAQLATTTVDLIIADLVMPEVDGLTLLRAIRADVRYHHIPLIMLTASGQARDRQVVREAGANDFLTKPSGSRELLETVNRVLCAQGQATSIDGDTC